jgi:hypothetical protein
MTRIRLDWNGGNVYNLSVRLALHLRKRLYQNLYVPFTEGDGMIRRIVVVSLILLAALSRLVPHMPNVSPITALALFGGVYLDKKYAFLIPIGALLISDFLLGFYPGIEWVYGSFLATGLIGLWLRGHRGALQTVGATLAGSLLFFVVTNFGVWTLIPGMYPHTLEGLGACYTAAIPFFRNTLIGDLAYVGSMFGLFELVRRYVPALGGTPDANRI